jgi:hypothetical protein
MAVLRSPFPKSRAPQGVAELPIENEGEAKTGWKWATLSSALQVFWFANENRPEGFPLTEWNEGERSFWTLVRFLRDFYCHYRLREANQEALFSKVISIMTHLVLHTIDETPERSILICLLGAKIARVPIVTTYTFLVPRQFFNRIDYRTGAWNLDDEQPVDFRGIRTRFRRQIFELFSDYYHARVRPSTPGGDRTAIDRAWESQGTMFASREADEQILETRRRSVGNYESPYATPRAQEAAASPAPARAMGPISTNFNVVTPEPRNSQAEPRLSSSGLPSRRKRSRKEGDSSP